MLTVVNKISVLPLALVLAFTFAACTEKELTQEEIEQIVAKSAAATAQVDTCKFNTDIAMTIAVIGGPEPGEKMKMTFDSTGVVDSTNQEMQTTVDMTIDVAGQAEQQMTMELYIVYGRMYMKVDIPELGEQWTKMRLTEETWEEQSQIEQQIELLETATEVNLLGSEDVSGTACYVVEIVPSMETLSELLSQQQMPGTEGIDFGELNLATLIKEISIKEWIAKDIYLLIKSKDSYLLMKSELHMLMEMSPKDIGATEGDFEKMTMDMNIEFVAYDYNEPVSIELPQEASEAQRMPGS